MKNLYWKYIYIDADEYKEPFLIGSPRLIYCSEAPINTSKKIENRADLKKRICREYIDFCTQHNISDKKLLKKLSKECAEQIRCCVGTDYKPKRFTPPVFCVAIYKPFDYILDVKRLSKELSADDFIHWMKDNGINTCPIMKGE